MTLSMLPGEFFGNLPNLLHVAFLGELYMVIQLYL